MQTVLQTAEADGSWYYYLDGKVAEGVTTVAQNAYGWFYINHGKVDFSYTDLHRMHMVGGRSSAVWLTLTATDWKPTSMLVESNGGQVDFTYTGLEANEYGWWMVINERSTLTTTDFRPTNMLVESDER